MHGKNYLGLEAYQKILIPDQNLQFSYTEHLNKLPNDF